MKQHVFSGSSRVVPLQELLHLLLRCRDADVGPVEDGRYLLLLAVPGHRLLGGNSVAVHEVVVRPAAVEVTGIVLANRNVRELLECHGALPEHGALRGNKEFVNEALKIQSVDEPVLLLRQYAVVQQHTKAWLRLERPFVNAVVANSKHLRQGTERSIHVVANVLPQIVIGILKQIEIIRVSKAIPVSSGNFEHKRSDEEVHVKDGFHCFRELLVSGQIDRCKKLHKSLPSRVCFSLVGLRRVRSCGTRLVRCDVPAVPLERRLALVQGTVVGAEAALQEVVVNRLENKEVSKAHLVDVHLCPSHAFGDAVHAVVNVEAKWISQLAVVSLEALHVDLAHLQPVVVVVIEEVVEVQLPALLGHAPGDVTLDAEADLCDVVLHVAVVEPEVGRYVSV
mmetsp:Transcript_7028/g.29866  ORF Transcript_7028/g.29866 Transcript_7028/m.29866 type:complete len:395 (-) Transcript_7028:367-1551(-)